MTISIDTNIIVALWWTDDPLNRAAARLLHNAKQTGPILICAPVFAELMGDPGRSVEDLEHFLSDTGIAVEWSLDEAVWREAGVVYRRYIQRRRASHSTFPRRMLTDFLIGAHALTRGYALLTLDQRLYAAAFPRLHILAG